MSEHPRHKDVTFFTKRWHLSSLYVRRRQNKRGDQGHELLSSAHPKLSLTKTKKTNHKQTERRKYEKSQFRSMPHLPVCSRYGSPQRIHFAVPCSSRQPHPQVIRRILAEPRFQFGRKRGLREFAQQLALMIMLTDCHFVSTRLYVNPGLFFFIENNALYLWDYANGAQFELEERCVARIAQIAANPDVAPDAELDEELKANNIIAEKPFPRPEWGFGKPAEIFHFATRHPHFSLSESTPEEFTAAYVEASEDQFNDPEYSLRVRRDGPRIALPSPDLERLRTVSLWDSLKARRSCRTFDGTPISLVEISTLLYASFGEVHGPWTHLAENGLRELGIRRTSPSGGGIHPSQAYLIAMQVEGLEPGVYFYNGDVNDMTLISSVDSSTSLPSYLGGQPFVSGAAAGVFVTSVLNRVWKKYPHSRAYRIPLLDIGHLSQTFHLAAAALGLRSWLTAAFDDQQISALLKIADYTENPFLFLAVGHGSGDQLWPELVNFLKIH